MKNNTHIDNPVSIFKGGSARLDINKACKFLLLVYLPQQCRDRKPIVSKVTLCLEWGETEFISVISHKVRVVATRVGWLIW